MPSSTSSNRPLVLIHLSDIHLSEGELRTQNLDLDIRKKVLADLRQPTLPVHEGVDGILVTGDIAYGGAVAEYESAGDWLRELCLQVGCPPSRVSVVPGNHDVSNELTSQSVLDIHYAIRSQDQIRQLADRLRDQTTARALNEPFANFSGFARKFYEGPTELGQLHWESDDLRLNDNSILRLRGLNSAIVSDKHDKRVGKPCQVLGLKQVQLDDNAPNVAYLTLCHHPPRWLYDEQEVETYLNRRARIQLYGHDHHHRAHQLNNTLVVHAGALHPNRDEDEWEPRYNILSLHVNSEPPRKLHVDLYARVWNAKTTCFCAEANENNCLFESFTLSLPAWSQPEQPTSPSTDFAGECAPTTPREHREPMATHTISDRDVVYDYFEVPYPRRTRILLELNLVEAEDEGIPEVELIRRALTRARLANNIADLASALRKAIDSK